jgi:hypothetical protein
MSPPWMDPRRRGTYGDVTDPTQASPEDPDVAEDRDHHPIGASPEEAREAADDGPDDQDAQAGPGSANSRPASGG